MTPTDDDETTWARVAIRLEMARRFLEGGLVADATAEVMILCGIVADRKAGPPAPSETRPLGPRRVDLHEVRAGDVAERELPCPVCQKRVKVKVDGTLRDHANCEPPVLPCAPPQRERTTSTPAKLRPVRSTNYGSEDEAMTREQIMAARA